MSIPPQVAKGRFAARCALPGNPDQDLLGIVDSGATVTCIGVQARKRAGLKFAGESVRLKRVHRGHAVALGTCFGHVDMCGRTEHARVIGLGMGPGSEAAGINAILGWDVPGGLWVTLGGPGGTGSIGRRGGA